MNCTGYKKLSKRTNKTVHVLNLIARNRPDIENPIINEEFKEEVILIRDTLKNSAQSPVRADSSSRPSGEVGINAVEELVQEWLPETLRRFRREDSDLYRAEITVQALNAIPPQYVYIRGEKDFAELQKIKDAYKHQVIDTLVRLVLSIRPNSVCTKIS